MANLQREREEFLVTLTGEGVPLDVARAVLRDAATVQRMSVAACNGDYPCDNGERRVIPCPVCEGGVVKSDIKAGACSGCRAERRITARLAPFGVTPDFSGDPRGCCVKLRLPSGKRNDFGGENLFCVPTPNY